MTNADLVIISILGSPIRPGDIAKSSMNRKSPRNLSGRRSGSFCSQRGRTAPPYGKHSKPRTAGAERRPVVAGWAEKDWVKVEREHSDRTLRQYCGANRRGRRAAETVRVHSGELGERSEPSAGMINDRAAGQNGGSPIFSETGCRQ